jgi:hypothetical protein
LKDVRNKLTLDKNVCAMVEAEDAKLMDAGNMHVLVGFVIATPMVTVVVLKVATRLLNILDQFASITPWSSVHMVKQSLN